MSKRNIILLFIVLFIITILAFGFSYFYRPTSQQGNINQDSSTYNFFASFLPFGKDKKNLDQNNNNTAASAQDDMSTSNQDNLNSNSKLRKISSFPIAGFGLFTKERFKEIPPPAPITTETPGINTSTTPIAPPTEFVSAVRYVNRENGNIYQTFLDKIDERKFSSTVIPKVYDAFFGNKGNSVVMRYLKGDNETIETFIGNLPKEYLGADSIGTSEITGSFLPENITDVSISPDSSSLFYLFNSGENAIGVSYSFQNSSKNQIFSSPFTEWLSSWYKNNLISVTTKASYDFSGYSYIINSDKKDFNKVLGSIKGLTTLPGPSGKILYSDSNLNLYLFNTETNSSNSIGLRTLPEKCTWNMTGSFIYCGVPKDLESNKYPDSWYQGETSFSDEIWKVDVTSGNTSKIIDPSSEQGGEDIDTIKMAVDENENNLLFVNKKDSFLWKLNLNSSN